MKSYYTIFFCCLLFSSCIKPDNLSELDGVKLSYVDIKGFIAHQVAQLESQKPQVQKTTEVNGQKEETEHLQINWKKELSLFADADINKPILNRSYQADTITNNNTQDITYTAKEEALRVRKIHVQQTITGEILALSADFQEHNPIYIAEQHLNMRLNDGKMASYDIHGFQKTPMQDTLRYYMKAKILSL